MNVPAVRISPWRSRLPKIAIFLFSASILVICSTVSVRWYRNRYPTIIQGPPVSPHHGEVMLGDQYITSIPKTNFRYALPRSSSSVQSSSVRSSYNLYQQDAPSSTPRQNPDLPELKPGM
ncbi:hypothetical protein Ciccas_000065 [Cichlidogyrus casuarinus]|uniref:Uncharacterized protein n=1 Tax=Cichlidogyrus casuarinus TaxID=1844966 RepID=A0ABD2QPH2_9PLAT